MSDAKEILYKCGLPEDRIEEVYNTLLKASNLLAVPVEQLTYLYGTMFITGRVDKMDLMQLSSVGFPIFHELKEIWQIPKGGHLVGKLIKISDVDASLQNFVKRYS